MATSTIKKDMKIRTATISATTNSGGAINVATKIPNTATILDVHSTYTNCMCLPWLHNGSIWHVKCVAWNTMAAIVNTSLTLTIRYVD